MPEGSVGAVYLEFVVRDTVEKQVQEIAEKAKAKMQESFAGIEEAIGSELEKAVARASEAAASAAQNVGKAAAQAADAARTAANAVAESAASCGSKVEIGIGESFNKSVALAQAKVNQLERAFDAVGSKLDTLWNSGKFNPDDKATQSLLAQQEKLYAQIEAARERLAIEVQAAAQKQAAAEEAAAMKAAAATAASTKLQESATSERAATAQTEAAAKQAASEQEVAAAEQSATAQISLLSRIRNAASSVFSGIKTIGQGAFHAIGKAVSTFRNIASRAFNGLRSAVSGLSKVVGTLKSRFATAGKSVSGLGSRLKGIVSGALVFNLLSRALTNMVTYMGTAISSSDEMQTALNNLKGAAATAAAPLWEVLTPALTALANGAATALSYLTRLISFFTGKTVASMANAAKKIQSTASAAKKAMASLAGFDEIQKLDSGDDTSSGDSSENKTPNFDFQGQSSFLDSALAAIQSGNWAQVGSLFAQKLNDTLSAIKWPDIQAKVQKWVQGAVDALNGFVGTLDWGLLGGNIRNGINTVLLAVDTFFQGTDWGELGSGLATGLNDLFAGLDWETLGSNLTNGIKAALEALHGFVTTFDFTTLGDDLATATMSAFNNVDWVQGAKDLGDAAIGLVDMLTAWLEGIDWQQIGNTIADAITAVDWSGLVSSLTEGIGAACSGLAELIWGLLEDAWASVVEWWEETAYEDGQFTIEELLNGILDVFSDIGNWIVENIFDPFMEGFGDAFKDPVNSIIGFINGMISGICDGINTVIRAMNKLQWDIPDWIPGIGGQTFGFNIGEVTAPQIPMLADGGVIKQPTLAMMGEYSGARNNPEIVAPQALIEQTMENVMREYSGDMVQCFDAVVATLKDILEAITGIEIDGQALYNIVKGYRRRESIITGKGGW